MAGAAVAAVVVGGALIGLTGGSDDPGPSGPEGPAAVDGDTLTVVVDGWSVASLGGEQLKLSMNGSGAAPLELRAATSADLAAILEQDPQALVGPVARMVTADPTLTCTSDGCATSSGPVDLDALVEAPAEIPVYGPVYEAHGVTSGLWVAEVPLSVQDVTATVTLDGVGPTVTLRPVSEAPELEAPAEEGPGGGAGGGIVETPGGDLQVPSPVDDTEDGRDREAPKGARVVSVAAAFGRAFAPAPGWLSGDAAAPGMAWGVQRPVVTPVTEPVVFDPAALRSGLAAKVPATVELTDTQMTGLSSPTVGCSVGVLCAPTADGITVDGAVVEELVVCDSGDDIAHGASVTPLQLLLEASTWSFDGSRPVAQFGNWEGASPDAGELWWTEPFPVTGAGTAIGMRAAFLLDGAGNLISVSGAAEPGAAGSFTFDDWKRVAGDRFERCETLDPFAPPVIEPEGEQVPGIDIPVGEVPSDGGEVVDPPVSIPEPVGP